MTVRRKGSLTRGTMIRPHQALTGLYVRFVELKYSTCMYTDMSSCCSLHIAFAKPHPSHLYHPHHNVFL